MSKVLEETGCAVLSSDLYDRGYGEVGLDFLTSTRYADNIVTNPPTTAPRVLSPEVGTGPFP
jgi:hypothetical protein